jgi:hypothetical protein
MEWSEYVKPVSGTESCEKHHIIYIISGTLASRMKNGKKEEFRAGEMGIILPAMTDGQ